MTHLNDQLNFASYECLSIEINIVTAINKYLLSKMYVLPI